MTKWSAVQLAAAVAGTVAVVNVSGVFVTVPDMTAADRWQLLFETPSVLFAGVAVQVAVLNLPFVRTPATRPRLALRAACMVLLGAAMNAAAMTMLWTDSVTLRLGIMESTTTMAWFVLYQQLLIGVFLLYQHGGRARSEGASHRLQQLQREQRAARRRLVEAQLQAMQARVDPQMFFDVLDGVQRLYAADPKRAEALLDELIVFLRAALPRLRSASSTLAQEFELAASYFRLQTLRSGAPAVVCAALPDALAARAFPAGVILPLLADLKEATVAVDVCSDGRSDELAVSLRATRAPAAPVLEQVRGTLSALYGSTASLECRDAAPDANVETRITLAHDAA